MNKIVMAWIALLAIIGYDWRGRRGKLTEEMIKAADDAKALHPQGKKSGLIDQFLYKVEAGKFMPAGSPGKDSRREFI